MDRRKYFNGKIYDAAENMTYDTDLVFFKRFRRLNYYNLFKLQNDLTKLDTDLAVSVVTGDAEESEYLSLKIRDTLKQYNDALVAQYQLGAAQPPAPQAVRTMKEFLENMNNEVGTKQLDLEKDEPDTSDLVALVQVDKSWTHQFIDEHQSLRKLFEKPSPNESVMIYSEDGIRQTVRFVVPLTFCAFIMTPVIIMSFYKDNNVKLGILSGFIFGVSAIVCWLTKAKDWEVLTVTAGYCAILVVFLGQNQTS